MEVSDVKRAAARVLKKQAKNAEFASITVSDVIKLVAKRLCVDVSKVKAHKQLMLTMMKETYALKHPKAQESPAAAQPVQKRQKTSEALSPAVSTKKHKKKKADKEPRAESPAPKRRKSSSSSSKKKKKSSQGGDNGAPAGESRPKVDRSKAVKKLHTGEIPQYAPLFCRECGSLLGVDTGHSLETLVRCHMCSHGVNIGTVLKSRIKHNVTENAGAIELLFPELKKAQRQQQQRQQEQDDAEASNPLGRARVDEACPSCGEPRVLYYTRQLRSADEGQTVFYECEVCHHEWNENT